MFRLPSSGLPAGGCGNCVLVLPRRARGAMWVSRCAPAPAPPAPGVRAVILLIMVAAWEIFGRRGFSPRLASSESTVGFFARPKHEAAADTWQCSGNAPLSDAGCCCCWGGGGGGGGGLRRLPRLCFDPIFPRMFSYLQLGAACDRLQETKGREYSNRAEENAGLRFL